MAPPTEQPPFGQGKSVSADGKLRIVFCHLESLTCLPALNLLFDRLGDRIALVVRSNVGPRQGGFFRQLAKGVRSCGLPMTLWLGFDVIAAQVVSRIAAWRPALLGRRPPPLATLPELARRHGARLVETADINGPDTVELIRRHTPDLILVMNLDQILRPPLIAVPRIAVLNVHPSLLPALRGPCPVFWALALRCPTAGATIHRIEDAAIDAGPILAQVGVPIGTRPSVAELNGQLFLSAVSVLETTVQDLVSGDDRGRPQDLSAHPYRGFPTAAEVSAARKQGIRLWGAAHIFRLISAALGLAWFGAHRLAADPRPRDRVGC